MKYDYQCESCGYQQEVEHAMSEDPQVFCPNHTIYLGQAYGAVTTPLMVRKITQVNFVLKGSGYYSTDARKITTASEVLGSGVTYNPDGTAK